MRSQSRIRLSVRQLEDRLTPAVLWDGGAGSLNWGDPLNWSSDALPSSTDDVSIAGAAGEISVGGSATVKSLSLGNSLAVGGSLTVTDGFAMSAGVSLYAVGGGAVTLTGLSSFDSGLGPNRFRADGAGSSISMPALTQLKGGSFDTMYVEALNGGQVSAPALTSFTGNYPAVTAAGAGSKVDLPAVASLKAGNAGTLSATNGGTANVPGLTQLDHMGVTVDATSTLPTSQFTELTNGSFTATGQGRDLSGVTNFSGSSLVASGGAKLTLPGTAYSAGTGNPTLQADGAGSELSLTNIASLGGSSAYFLNLRATNGGVVHVPLVTQLNAGYFDLSAEGAGSQLDLPNLTTIDNGASYSLLSATKGGVVDAPNLTQLVNVFASIDATSSAPLAGITSVSGGAVTVHGGARSMTSLTSATATAFTADLGGSLTLPALTSFDGGSGQPAFTADGAGSQLSLPNLTSLTGASFFYTKFIANAGGTVSAPALTAITSGFPQLDAIGGELSMPQLSDVSAPAGNFGFLTVSNGGKLTSASGLSLTRVTARIEPTSQFTLSSLSLGTGAALTGTGSLAADVSNAGEIAPGNSGVGDLTITGDYTQSSGGRLVMELGGAGQSDGFHATGTAHLGGTMQVSLVSGFTPQVGATYPMITFGTRDGQFSGYAGFDVGSNVELEPLYSSGGVSLRGNPSSGAGVTSTSPDGNVFGPVTFVDFYFTEALSPPSVSADDAEITGPDGPITVSDAFAISPTAVRVVFPAQTKLGSYSLHLGPNIADAAGNLMNQNQNGTNGETDDRFGGGFTIINSDTTPPTVSLFQINGGQSQRSMVQEIRLEFSEPVVFPPNALDAFTLQRLGPGGLTVEPLPVPEITQSPWGTTVVRFVGPTASEEMIVNGDYKIITMSAKVSDAAGNPLDGLGNGTAGDFTVGFHQLSGDSDGNRSVDIVDLLAFRISLGATSGGPNYQSYFDFNHNDSVDLLDFLTFRSYLGTTY